MRDHEGFLAFIERSKRDEELMNSPGNRIFYNENKARLQLN